MFTDGQMDGQTGEHAFLCGTCCPDLIHIPIKLHEDILKGC